MYCTFHLCKIWFLVWQKHWTYIHEQTYFNKRVAEAFGNFRKSRQKITLKQILVYEESLRTTLTYIALGTMYLLMMGRERCNKTFSFDQCCSSLEVLLIGKS